MNKITKKISIWIAMMFVVLSFGACGGESVEQQPALNDQTNQGNQETNKDNENSEDSTGNDDNQNGGDNATEEDSVKLATTTDKELSKYLLRVKDPGSDLYGYVDIRTGDYAIVPQFTDDSDAEFGNDGWAKVWFEDKTKAVINTSGEYLIAPEKMKDATLYGDGVIVVSNAESTKAFLYHDAELVKELELPQQPADGGVHVNGLAYYQKDNHYTSNTAINIWAKNAEGKSIDFWYDFDGNYCYQTDVNGNLIVDDEYNYFFGTYGKVIVLDKAGNELEEKDLGSRISKAYMYGDKWYIAVERKYYYLDVYSNGLEKVLEAKFGSTVLASMAQCDTDEIFALAGKYYKPDGTLIFNNSNSLDGYYAFLNGYAKVINALRDEYGFIDMEGNFVLTMTADDINNCGEIYPGGLLPYRENGLWGVKDMQGNIIWSPRYPSLGIW